MPALARGARRLPVRGGVPRPARVGGRAFHHRRLAQEHRRQAGPAPPARLRARPGRAVARDRGRGAGAMGRDQGAGARHAGDAEDAARRHSADAARAASRVPHRHPRRVGRLRLGDGRTMSSGRFRRRSTNCARSSTRAVPLDHERAEEEMGDLLFSIANLSRQLGIEPETALRKANDKFTQRFETMEQSIAAVGTRDEGDVARRARTGVAAGSSPNSTLNAREVKANTRSRRAQRTRRTQTTRKTHPNGDDAVLANEPSQAVNQHRHVEVHQQADTTAADPQVAQYLRLVNGM